MLLNLIYILASGGKIGEAGVGLHVEANENTYEIARWLMKFSHSILKTFGLSGDSVLYVWVYTILVLILAFSIGYVCKWCILGIVRLVSKKVNYELFSLLVSADFFRKLCKIVPPLVFLIFIEFTLSTRVTLALWLTRITWIYVIFTIVIAVNSLVSVIWKHVDSRENTKHLPLNGIAQLVKGIVWIVAVIIVVAILFDKSPGSLLAGLGAFAAVLMLIFKDSILGVVAGVQLSENDSLHVGDWIKVHGTDANGNVTEVSLTSVKIENFDKTVTTVPPYNLISNGFTNYNTMQRSDTRRICRCLMIDADSVVFLTDEMLEKFKKIPLMEDFISEKMAQRASGKVEDVGNSAGLPNGTIDTNLGLFRAYVQMYLSSNKYISHKDTCFVSTLEQTGGGIPLQVYAFTNTSSWIDYEAIQDTIFEHLLVIMTQFGLYVFENASGRDEILNGYLETGNRSDILFGLPFPLYKNSLNPVDTGALPKGVNKIRMEDQASS
ncbi:MAG: mechanosensitive ion channel [Muribaculaceae bacterium]|nr:mechanosensitive ion channel [Muribaculaceae bacterium]